MKKNHTARLLRNIGLPLAVAGVVLFALPNGSDASGKWSSEVTLLQEGAEGTKVEQLQELLTDQGFLDEGQVNGSYNQETLDAVTSFQKDYHLVVDGIAGPQTLGSLLILREGDENKLVEDLQQKLQNLGYYENEVHGVFDSATQKAVKAFQQAEGIGVDGLAGPETYATLYYSTNATAEATRESEAAAPKQVQATTTASTEVAPSSAEQATYEMEATAYTAYCEGCSGTTATGIDLRSNPNAKVVAVDPNVIPLGTRVHVEGYGEAIAGDTGGAINGHKIDLHMPTKEEARNFGRQTVTVTVLD
ncbi:peptidoglycan-binding protein [Halalkalibacterium ligniniphilum]|uniref:peptidoglycan-binding protein n=1 Tax=Halalkalibacterium ligniniphilum TaxID=1134413 RepID=UPI00034AF0A4|nr:peptidoglycan-binding protein [Halalkalibacterium ligniniphilum]